VAAYTILELLLVCWSGVYSFSLYIMFTPTSNFNSSNCKNLCNLAKCKVLKLHEDNTEVSKHVGVNIT